MKKNLGILITLILLLVMVIPAAAYSGHPVFSILSVERDKSVTIQGYNFPANDKFTVTMGAMGTKGIGGIVVATTDSGSGGTLTKTYTIPAALAGSHRIAIRMQSPTTGFFAYNWFFNNTTGGTSPTPTPKPGTGYTGFPTFSIAAVQRDKTVTIKGHNFPPNDKFTLTMGAYGTKGIGGIVVETVTTGSDGSLSNKTYTIPAALAGSHRIAIRLQSPTTGYFAYNWFFNNNAP